jgi:hypothetical protein
MKDYPFFLSISSRGNPMKGRDNVEIKLRPHSTAPGAGVTGKKHLQHRANPKIPAGISIVRQKNQLILSRRWLCLRMWIYVFGGVLFVILGLMLFITRRHCPQVSGLDISQLLLLCAIGVFYYVTAILLNKTRITVNRSTICIKHYPFPWLGNKQIEVHLLTQLYVKTTVVRRSRGHGIPIGGTSYQYDTNWFELRALDNLMGDIRVLEKLPSKEQALFIEREIENFLGIQNKSVHGEVDPAAKPQFTFS